jgi:hypothetical protein
MAHSEPHNAASHLEVTSRALLALGTAVLAQSGPPIQYLIKSISILSFILNYLYQRCISSVVLCADSPKDFILRG